MTEPSTRVLRPADREGPVILAAVSPTPRGQLALALACQLAADTGSHLDVVSVTKDDLPAQDQTAALERLAEQTAAAETGEAGCRVSVRRLPSHHADEEYGRAVCLIDAAADAKAWLTVLGTHDIAAKNKPLSGSMTFRLLERTPGPLLIAANDPPRAYRKVAIATDFSDVAPALFSLAARLGGGDELVVFHAAASEDEASHARRRTDELAEQLGIAVPVRTEIRIGKAKEMIATLTAEERPDLLVIGTRGRSAVARLVLGSAAKSFVDRPPCDLLVVRSGSEDQVLS